MNARLYRMLRLQELGPTVGVLLLSFVVGGLVLAVAGYNPFEAYGALARGSFGSLDAIANTLAKSTPLLFTGLAVAIAFRGGLFNIGAEGQLHLGALTAALAGVYFHGLPGFLHIAIAMILAGVAGALWSSIAGWMKVRWNAHEVIVTIMLNYIAISLTDYLVNYTFKAEGMVPRTEEIAQSATLLQLLPHSQWTIGFLFALAGAAVAYWFLQRTVAGYEIRAVGLNAGAARTGGVSVGRRIVLAMLVSGAFAGLAGAVEVLGVHHYFVKGLSPGYGFDGIAVAVLARNHPLGVILSAILFGALRSGSMLLDRTTDVPGDFVIIIQALVILFVAIPWLFRHLRLKKRGDAR
ncbi:ABC transporter permease [Paenibacillus sp.]|uniref:ABC transporter permease n=1 Tax=Paenibacillus sp. TaxID=58172 RepID=UPI002D4BD3DB|nr:ABC transporter permease [Paenibacillus sp.]HZG56623.1 ABC transporter permease [Paenibacillus sp.]